MDQSEEQVRQWQQTAHAQGLWICAFARQQEGRAIERRGGEGGAARRSALRFAGWHVPSTSSPHRLLIKPNTHKLHESQLIKPKVNPRPPSTRPIHARLWLPRRRRQRRPAPPSGHRWMDGAGRPRPVAGGPGRPLGARRREVACRRGMYVQLECCGWVLACSLQAGAPSSHAPISLSLLASSPPQTPRATRTSALREAPLLWCGRSPRATPTARQTRPPLRSTRSPFRSNAMMAW